ncbi:MAG: D-tyrosyl-tRNA(Tyr) deacylase [Ignavibacteriales bacterium]|nr:D-tyrosyl-tRNA(Tyr) deacylase [Ignavibacteriales bacterium]
MRALIQRVKRCSVSVEGNRISEIGKGVLVLLAVHVSDAGDDALRLADRCGALRIFDDAEGKMNLSIADVSGEVMVVSQFTLYGDTRKGNRPSYTEAAPPEQAETLYKTFVERLRTVLAPNKVATGVFRALMDVELVNDGPVTVMVEGKKA